MKLHRLSVFEQLLDGSLNVRNYARMMGCFHDFYIELDARMSRACAANSKALCGYRYQVRAPIFAADIAELGVELEEIPPRPVCFSLPKIDSMASVAGVAYVVEGSMLGGMMMSKAVSSLLPGNNTGGGGYWNWCRLRGAAQWKSALTLINACWQIEGNRSAITSSAVGTFEALNDALNPEGYRQLVVAI